MAVSGQMAMGDLFLMAFARLPVHQQRKVSVMISKFHADPTSPGLNFERIHKVQSPGMRSLRIDKSYRAIVQQPPSGNQCLLLWAGKHDKAYEWASRHRCDINPVTGALQIYSPDIMTTTVIRQGTPPGPTGPFAALKPRQLVRVGVPEAMVGEIHSAEGYREPDGETVAESMKHRLPREAYEALFYYAAGESYETILRDRAIAEEDIDTSDFAKALLRRESMSRFTIVARQADLEAILNAPLEKWRVFLHPAQRQIVTRDWNGPVRVLGAAGTGKTVVAMHRARWLVREGGSAAKVLFVTFNKNLANDIRQNLGQICSPAEMRRIEVQNLDAWTYKFLRRHKNGLRIAFVRDAESWKEALSNRPASIDLPEEFYAAELEQVVQANGIQSLAGYKRVSRVGRGTPLHRAARTKVWRVFQTYQELLAAKGLRSRDDAYQDAIDIIRASGGSPPYSSVIVDEAQDLRPQAFRLIRSLAAEGKNDLFITGDCHQRIYGSKIVLGRCGVNIRGRSKKLRLNYRTTEQTRAWAARLLEGRSIDDLDGGTDDNRNIQSLTSGPDPLVRNFETQEEQSEAVVEYLQALEQKGTDLRDVCIVARTIRLRDAAKDALEEAGIDAALIEADGDDRHLDGVRLATMHRVKGLEFERVVVVSANDGILPLSKAMVTAADGSEREATETKERALVYVAASRAKQELLVLSYGQPSRFVSQERG